ncbi:SRPBCC family protein [Nocardioides sp. GY 10127]|uniref:SRPBCC family protein n=1 Tax=Nocardioides sp. GY 10127 TaxID=2569762 RepID=UPI0010A7894E|nr:SRPBCC family protein [Nocardioides sp. GY 10127]TIC80198.1 SRPBCC family protein [Nocardioides sp. GY 10127]
MVARHGSGRVRFGVPQDVAFDYLVDPANRPAWQSSLRAVTGVEGEPRVGQTWVDVTVPGLRPAMRTTLLERPHLWAESGRWRGVTATLDLAFTPAAAGTACDVGFRFRIEALGVLGLAATFASVPAVRADLKRAAAILLRDAG